MAKVNVVNVVILDNPSPFLNPFQFEVTFDCFEPLQEDLEWQVTYVGCAENSAYDQVLDICAVGPVASGRHRFVLQVDAPDPTKIPKNDVLGVTVVLLTCSYVEQEFIRIGYYVNNEYTEEDLRENPPEAINFTKISRNILASNPRVTKFPIDWEKKNLGESSSELNNKEEIKSMTQPQSQTTSDPSPNSKKPLSPLSHLISSRQQSSNISMPSTEDNSNSSSVKSNVTNRNGTGKQLISPPMTGSSCISGQSVSHSKILKDSTTNVNSRKSSYTNNAELNNVNRAMPLESNDEPSAKISKISRNVMENSPSKIIMNGSRGDM